MTQRTLIVCDDKADVVRRVARDARLLLVAVLEKRDSAHVVLTGGSVGIGVLEYLGAYDDHVLPEERVDWSRVHLWWGDERWVPAGHEDRNEAQAESVFVRALPFMETHIHRMPAADEGLTLDEAATAYSQELGVFLPTSSEVDVSLADTGTSHSHVPTSDTQSFDLVFLGVGPDAHVASLFPGNSAGITSSTSCIPVRDSPKPPPERLSLSLGAINSSAHVWLVTAGRDKAEAVGLALGPPQFATAPASAALGRIETRVYCDHSANPSR